MATAARKPVRHRQVKAGAFRLNRIIDVAIIRERRVESTYLLTSGTDVWWFIWRGVTVTHGNIEELTRSLRNSLPPGD